MFSLKPLILIFWYIVSMYFPEEFISVLCMVVFLGVSKLILKSRVLFVLGVSESFKSFWGIIGESGVESLFVVAKDKLLL